MKKTLLALLIAILLIAALPPQLPSSFYGTVSGYQPGQPLNAWAGGLRVAHTVMFSAEAKTVYRIHVPCTDGQKITFKSAGVVLGSAVCHTGTNVRQDLK